MNERISGHIGCVRRKYIMKSSVVDVGNRDNEKKSTDHHKTRITLIL